MKFHFITILQVTLHQSKRKFYTVHCLKKKKSVDNLQKLKNRAARALTFSNYDTDAAKLFERLNWENLSTQR